MFLDLLVKGCAVGLTPSLRSWCWCPPAGSRLFIYFLAASRSLRSFCFIFARSQPPRADYSLLSCALVAGRFGNIRQQRPTGVAKKGVAHPRLSRRLCGDRIGSNRAPGCIRLSSSSWFGSRFQTRSDRRLREQVFPRAPDGVTDRKVTQHVRWEIVKCACMLQPSVVRKCFSASGPTTEMSVNPCKHGDREKDQNNNFVNSSAHGGAGHDREGRARRATTRASAFASDEHQQTRSSRSATSYGYGNGQQGAHGGQPGARAGGDGTGPMGGGGGAGSGPSGPQVTAKVMWGNVSAIKELRDKEQSERQLGTRAAGRRQ
ncbi:hypothetical protein ZHAS_00020924 [Anopheles sinensis]|uniref:Uncharacterized protein n=1 Tax=Anopheles sinensis TaxID=74873 RepID=A0A084WR25_ANOSI|nr:hypothetical protein ZHAS_00020924 [Anopheles sinensis]